MSSITPQEAYDFFLKNLPNKTERERVQESREFKDFIYRWNHGVFNSWKKVGSLMKSVRAYSKLHNYDMEAVNSNGWAHYYMSNVRNPAQIYALIEEVAEGTQISLEKALCYWWIHIIDGALAGEQGEIAMLPYIKLQWLPEQGFTVREATDQEDRQDGLDWVIEDSRGTIVAAYQVKRASYFYSKRETVVKAREQVNPAKYRAYEARTGVKVIYVVIEKTLEAKRLFEFPYDEKPNF